MAEYMIRLDDACEKRHRENWERMEALLDRYGIKPLVGIIPDCRDPQMDQYDHDEKFWSKVDSWVEKGYGIAMHGCRHEYVTEEGGINPVNRKSEFAGLPLEEQKEKIRKGIGIFREHGLEPKVFFAPSHTFDLNTIEALKAESGIRIISDTIADRPYTKYGMTFVPQQSGRVRKLPFKMVTFCYHPNTMVDGDFMYLEQFIVKEKDRFICFPEGMTERKMSLYDLLLRKIYFIRKEG